MLMLIIGGAGYLYGGLIGAALFIVLRDVISAATPDYWEFWIGLLLVALVLVGRERIARLAARGRFDAPHRARARGRTRRERARARGARPHQAVRRAARDRQRVLRDRSRARGRR